VDGRRRIVGSRGKEMDRIDSRRENVVDRWGEGERLCG
jgi:hypothetical protein